MHSQRLWAPILRKSGLGGEDPSVSPGALPETAAFKAKIKVLSAWFHADGSVTAPTVVASSSQAVDGGEQSARTVAGAGRMRRGVLAGSKARGGGGAKAAGVSRGAGRRAGGAAAARKAAGGGVGANGGGPVSATAAR